MATTVAAMSTPDTRLPEADGSLIDRIVAGDDGALGHVYDRYGSLVYGLARRVTNSSGGGRGDHAGGVRAALGTCRPL